MNEFGLTLFGAALRVTLVALLGAAAYLIAARRAPRSAARILTLVLGLVVAVTGAALCPLPTGWDWRPSTEGAPPPTAPVDDATTSWTTIEEARSPTADGKSSGGLAVSPAILRSAWDKLQYAAATSTGPAEPTWRWPEIVAVVFLVGLGLGLLRLLVGVWAVHDCRSRSRLVEDAALRDVVQSIGFGLGTTRRVELRELTDLATAATIGWLRPVILLPPEWRSWTDAERRAVLAHELAHIRRGDYLTGCLARVGLVLHFYHPLVYWLFGRLQLQQELAADALGARLGGGRNVYLRVLAKMALGQAGRPCKWPARTFLPTPGTLTRRIEMLRAKDGSAEGMISRTGRVALTVALVCAAVGVSAVRGRGQRATDSQPNDTRVLNENPQDLRTEDVPGTTVQRYSVSPVESGDKAPAPFDMSYLPPDAQGAWAVRPSAIFGRPDMKEQTAKLNKFVVLLSKKHLNLPPELILPLEDFEQISGGAVIRTDKAKDERQSALLLQLTMIRSVKDFDWKKQIQTMIPKAIEVEHKGKTYLRVPKSAEVPPFLMGFACIDFCFYFPDRRTVVIEGEEAVRSHIEGKTPKSNHAWAEDWKGVERGLFANAFADKSWMDGRKKSEDPVQIAADTLVRNSSSLTFGFDYRTAFAFQFHCRCGSEKEADAATQAFKNLLELGQKHLAEADKDRSPDGKSFILLGHDLLKHSNVGRKGLSVSWTAEAKGSLAELVGSYADMLQELAPSSPTETPK